MVPTCGGPKPSPAFLLRGVRLWAARWFAYGLVAWERIIYFTYDIPIRFVTPFLFVLLFTLPTLDLCLFFLAGRFAAIDVVFSLYWVVPCALWVWVRVFVVHNPVKCMS